MMFGRGSTSVVRRCSRFLELRNSEYPLLWLITNLVFLKASSLVKVSLLVFFLWEAPPIVMVPSV